MIGISRTLYCFVKLPNSVVLDVDVDPKADAQECLHKVLDHLNIIESDYFGLQYVTKEGSPTWLNLRNPIDQQLGLSGQPPYRLSLRVKFFVQPHRLQQTSTKVQFYLNIKQDFLEGKLRFLSAGDVVTLAACIAQAEHGGDAMNSLQYAHLLPPDNHDVTPPSPGSPSSLSPEALVQAVAEMHRGMMELTAAQAQYRLLQTAAQLNCYGMEFFQVGLEPSAVNELYGNRNSVKQVKGQSQHNVGVGPEGVFLYNSKWKQRKMYPYPSVHRITSSHRSFKLVVFREDGNETELDVRLPSKTVAGALYRCVTEMYCFYLCETVRDNVTTQFSRDIKGTFVSLFNENSAVGKKYTFDIRRTSNEAYDFYRRTLYKAGAEGQQQQQQQEGTTTMGEIIMDTAQGAQQQVAADEHASVKEQLQQMQESVLCCLCIDANLSIVFQPCHHVVCCTNCAERVDTCPVCRHEIEDRQPIFMPGLPSKEERTKLVVSHL